MDIGKCDMALLGGSTVPGMEMPFTGQVLVNNSCAGGTCHSAGAKGAQREGVPAGFNFDTVPLDTSPAELTKVQKGSSEAREYADQMWDLLSEGQMPPEGKRTPPTAQEKEAVRNWLACNSPVVAVPTQTAMTTDFNVLYMAFGDKLCTSCHTALPGTNTFLSGGNACAAYTALVNQPASGMACAGSGQTLVVPGNPDASLLVHKLTDPAPPCGVLMPQGATTPLSQTDPQFVQSLRDWITAGAPKPAGCP